MSFDIPEGPSPEELAKYDLNDYGHALRLIRLAGGRIVGDDIDTTHCRLLYLMGQGWIGYNGKHWDIEFGTELAKRMSHAVTQKMRNPEVRDGLANRGLDGKEIRKLLDAMGQSGATSAMLAQAQPYLTVKIEAFDQHPMAVNCQNGTVWMVQRAGGIDVKFKGHSPADRLTRIMATVYDAKATAPHFIKTVEFSLRDAEVRACFQRALGYTFTSFTYEQVFFITQGPGGDGKSTILNAVRQAMGSYAATGKVETFLDSGQMTPNGPQPELVKLAGDTRLVMLPEPQRGARLNESLVKQWTGGDTYSARQLQAKPFEFDPIAHPWIMCNALPQVKGDDEGIWRRLFIFMFPHKVPDSLKDKQLPFKLKAELPGIFNWLISGVGDWLGQGLNPPESLQAIKDNYRKSSSPFGDWLSECTVFGEEAKGAVTPAGVLYANYKEWAEANGHDKPMTMRAFGDALLQRQIMHGPRMNDGKKTRSPVRIKSHDELSADQRGLAPAGQSSGSATPFDDGLSMEGYDD